MQNELPDFDIGDLDCLNDYNVPQDSASNVSPNWNYASDGPLNCNVTINQYKS